MAGLVTDIDGAMLEGVSMGFVHSTYLVGKGHFYLCPYA
jgi:hypothetical protein